jgi:AsmA protein
MKKIFKIFIGLVLVALLAIAALIFTFDANNYKAQIIEQVEQKTGREFKIEGNIDLSVFPWIGLKVGKVMLGNAQGFSERDFAEIKQLDIKVLVLPLLKRDVRVDKVGLHGLSVSLEVDDQGRNNWADLLQTTSDGSSKTSKPAQSPEQGTSALAGLAVNGIKFVDGNIHWSDARTNTQAAVSGLSLETSAIRFNEPVSVDFSAHVTSNQPEADADISMQTKLKFNEALNVFDVDGLGIDVQTMMPSVSNEPITLELKTNAHVDLKRKTASLTATDISALGAVLVANLDITHLDSEPKIKGSISTNAINGRAVAEQLGIELPPMANASSLTRVLLESNINATPSSLHLDKFKIELDQSRITGWVHVLDVAQPNVKYSLKMSPINLDNYMAPVPEKAGQAGQQVVVQNDSINTVDAEPTDVEIPLPVELLRTLGLNGLFKIEQATIQNIEITDINITTQAGGGLIRVKPVTMNLLRGQMEMGVDLDVRQIPTYSIAVNANELHAGPVLNPVLEGVMGDEEIKIEGAVKLTADIKTNGNSLLALKKAATGTVNFDMNQTSVTGVDIQYFARNAIVDYLEEKKLDVSPEWRGEYQPKQTTAFRKIHASAVIAQGKVVNDDFIMDSKRIKVTGAGEVDIVNNAMDYNSLIDLTPDRTKIFAEKLLDEPMGVHIHGPFEKLAIEPDTKRIAKAAKNLLSDKAKAEARKKIEAKKKKLKKKADREKEEAKKELEDKLKKKLKGLF